MTCCSLCSSMFSTFCPLFSSNYLLEPELLLTSGKARVTGSCIKKCSHYFRAHHRRQLPFTKNSDLMVEFTKKDVTPPSNCYFGGKATLCAKMMTALFYARPCSEAVGRMSVSFNRLIASFIRSITNQSLPNSSRDFVA